MDEEQAARWEDICRTYKRNLVLGAAGGDDQLGQIIAQMTTFSDGLHGISSTLDKSMKTMLAKDDNESESLQAVTLREISRVVGELAKFNGTLESIKIAYEQHGETIAKLPRHLSEHKIEVVNKVPNVILNVLRNQFRVLQTWMEPILKLAETNPQAESFVRASKATEANYQRLMDKMASEEEEAPEDDGATH